MAPKPKTPKSPTEITSIRYKKDTRVNIPTEELRDWLLVMTGLAEKEGLKSREASKLWRKKS
jgi:hypothetical protein